MVKFGGFLGLAGADVALEAEKSGAAGAEIRFAANGRLPLMSMLLERHSVIQRVSPPAAISSHISAAIVQEDGSIALVLDPAELIGAIEIVRQNSRVQSHDGGREAVADGSGCSTSRSPLAAGNQYPAIARLRRTDCG